MRTYAPFLVCPRRRPTGRPRARRSNTHGLWTAPAGRRSTTPASSSRANASPPLVRQRPCQSRRRGARRPVGPDNPARPGGRALPYRQLATGHKTRARQLANGVTAFRDPGQWDEYFADLRATIAADGLRGPRIHTAGPHIDGPGPAYPRDSVVARDADEARQFAERAVAQGATAIKIYFRLPLASAKAVIDVCRQRHVTSTAHLEILEAAELFLYGLDGIEHITSLGPSLLPQIERERYRQAVLADNAARGPGRYAAFAGLDLDSADARALWAVIGSKRPFIDATLAVFEQRPGVSTSEKDTAELIATRANGFKKMLATTRRALDAGGRIVMGGHSSVPFAGRGEAPWREMELLVDAGLTPMQAIVAATANGADFLGRSRDLGTIEPGKLADLIVLTGNPLARIAEIRTVERVLAGGAWVDVEKYRKD